MNMFAPRGYTAVPQDAAASQDEDEAVENTNDSSSSSFEQRKNWSSSRSAETMSTPRTSRESEEGGGETKERRVKRNVRFETRSLEDKPEPMSSARRLCFVVSLMICTLTIFVFAFTVPCKGPSCNVANMITTVTSNLEKYHRNWSMSFTGYSTGIVSHLSSTKSREVVLSYGGKIAHGKDSGRKHEESNKRNAVENKRNTKESGLISLSEDDGKLLWTYNTSDVIKLIECRTDGNGFETCLIQSSHGRLQLINPHRNQIIWSTRIIIGSLLPSIIIGISDCDGDDGRDILLSYDRFNTTCVPPTNKTTCTHPGIVQLISGRTGYPLGTRLNIPQSHLIKRVSVHSTRQAENLIFVLTVGNKGHLKVISIQDLYNKILEAPVGESPYLFKNSTVSVSEIVSTDHEPVVKDLNKDFVEDIILVTLAGNKHSLTAVDGGKLRKMWRIAFGFRKMLSQPVVGHFNDDEVPDILVILEDPVLSLLNQSLVQILDGQNGKIIWSRKLRLAKNTSPLSANIGYKNDVFLFWIEKETGVAYHKTFLSKAPKHSQVHRKRTAKEENLEEETLTKSASVHGENVSEDFTEQERPRRDRSPRSAESREKEASSVSDVEDELDSLVDEIFVKDFAKSPATALQKKSTVKARSKRKRIENTHKILKDILKRVDEPLTVTGKESRLHGGKPKTTVSSRLSTQRPVIHDLRAFHSKPNTRTRPKQVKTNSHNGRNNDKKPTSPTLAAHSSSLYTAQLSHSRTTREVKDKLAVGKMIKNNAGIEHTVVKKLDFLMNNNPRTTATSKINIGRLLNDNFDREIVNKQQTVVTTNKPSTMLSQMKRVEQLVDSSGRGSARGNNRTVAPVTGNHHLHDVRQSPTSALLTEQSLKVPNAIHDMEKKQNPAMVHREVTTNSDNSDGNNRKQSPKITLKFHGNIHSKPATKKLKLEKNIMRTLVEKTASRGSNDHSRQNPTVSLPTMPHKSSQGDVRMIRNKTIRKTVNDERVEDVTNDNSGTEVSNPGGGTSHTGENISTMVLSPTSHTQGQHYKKTDSGSTGHDKTTEQNLVSDVNLLPGRVQAPEPGFSISHNDTKIANATRSISNPSLLNSDRQKAITVKEMTNTKGENSDSNIRQGKDIIVLRTNSSISKHLTGENGGKPAGQREQRQIDSKNSQAAKRRQQQKGTTKNKRPSTVNERSRANNSLLSDSDGQHSKITAATLSQKAHNQSQVVSDLLPTTRPGQASEIHNGETATNNIFNTVKPNETESFQENGPVNGKTQKSNTSETVHNQERKLSDIHHTTSRPHTTSSKKKHDFGCLQGFDLALIAIFPDSPRNSFTVISQENSITKTKDKTALSQCNTLWPTLNSSPLVHDADSDGFLEIIYAVNYGEEDVPDARTMRVRKFSIKIDTED